jgi:signal transduction histidine kinase
MLSVYLEFCPPFTDNSGKQVRYEFLDLEKYTTPANEAQQKFNATIDDIADAIRCERYISLVHKDYEFLSKMRINEDFLEYFHRNIVYRGIKFKVSLKYLHRFCKGKCSFKDVTVSFSQNDPVYVWADEYMTEQVLSNYITNALNHLDDNHRIEIKVTTEGDKAHISVFNSGEPIPEDQVERIWDKFYKVDKARTREYGGHGIGLSIVKAIMESFKQDYGVRNYENGVEFWFELSMR